MWIVQLKSKWGNDKMYVDFKIICENPKVPKWPIDNNTQYIFCVVGYFLSLGMDFCYTVRDNTKYSDDETQNQNKKKKKLKEIQSLFRCILVVGLSRWITSKAYCRLPPPTLMVEFTFFLSLEFFFFIRIHYEFFFLFISIFMCWQLGPNTNLHIHSHNCDMNLTLWTRLGLDYIPIVSN